MMGTQRQPSVSRACRGTWWVVAVGVAFVAVAPRVLASEGHTGASKSGITDGHSASEQPSNRILPPREKTANQAMGGRAARKIQRTSEEAGSLDRAWYRSAIGSLAIVLALLGVGYWMVKRWMPAARRMDTDVLKVVARTTLSPKHSVALLRLGRRFVMVGMAPDGINLLSEIDGPEEVADLVLTTEQAGSSRETGFEDLLDRESRGYRSRDTKDTSAAALKPLRRVRGRDQLTDLLHRLRHIRADS